MTTVWTKITKASGTSWTKTSGGITMYDDVVTTYDSSTTNYDGQFNTWTNIAKATGTSWTKIAKAT